MFTPITLRDVTVRNRVWVAPMCQYSAVDGVPNDWHLVHLGSFARGGAGLVFTEATAVTADGRISPEDTGLWNAEQQAAWAHIVDFVHRQGATAGIQLAHAGRKGSTYSGFTSERGGVADADGGWRPVAPSAEPFPGLREDPEPLDRAGIERIVAAFGEAAERAMAAGFDVLEVHAAHGYLLHQFLSPMSNHRDDEYGGSLEGRMRFPLEGVEAVRAGGPADRALFVRVSAVDGARRGITIEDTVAFCRELAARGVDIVDVSGGGIGGGWEHPIGYGYQVPYAARIRAEAGIATMAVGLLVDAAQAEAVVAGGQADLVALAREAQDDPNFAVHALRSLADGSYDAYPVQAGPRLAGRARLLDRLGPWTGPDPVQVEAPAS